jgi:hypothetical protein
LRIYVLVEPMSSAMLLDKLLWKEKQTALVEIRPVAPTSSLYSAARTLLIVRGKAVAVLLNADSTVPEAVERRRIVAEEVVGEPTANAAMRVLIAVPALEALLFLRPDLVARAFGPGADGERILELGRVGPREALNRLQRDERWWLAAYDLIAAFGDEDVADLRTKPPIDDLLRFVSSVETARLALSSKA